MRPLSLRHGFLAVLVASAACGPVTPHRDGASDIADADDAVSSLDADDTGGDGFVPGDATRTDVRSSDAGPFIPVQPPSRPLPMTNYGGPTIPSPQLVFLSYPGDPMVSRFVSFLGWLPTSSYFTSSLSEYGITAGSFAGAHTFAAAPPRTYSQDAFADDLDAAIASNAFGTPTPSTIYVVHLPGGVTFSESTGRVNCTDWTGFHGLTRAGHAYAVVATCATDTPERLTAIISHEVAEAVTDPAWNDLDGWLLLGMQMRGGEVADLCGDVWSVQEGQTVQRLFSNAAAAAGADPCVPADPATGYVGVAPIDGPTLTIAPGATVTTTWRVFGTAPAPDGILFAAFTTSDLTLSVSPCAPSGAAGWCLGRIGDTVTITVTASASTRADYTQINVETYDGTIERSEWNMRVQIQRPTCHVLARDCAGGDACQQFFDQVTLMPEARCYPAGPGNEGATCGSDFDCASGLTCGFGHCRRYCGVCDPANTSDPCGRASFGTASMTYCDPTGASPTFCTVQTGYSSGVPFAPVAMFCQPGCDLTSTSNCTTGSGRSGGCYFFPGGPLCGSSARSQWARVACTSTTARRATVASAARAAVSAPRPERARVPRDRVASDSASRSFRRSAIVGDEDGAHRTRGDEREQPGP